jgi:hypothetical protein
LPDPISVFLEATEENYKEAVFKITGVPTEIRTEISQTQLIGVFLCNEIRQDIFYLRYVFILI